MIQSHIDSQNIYLNSRYATTINSYRNRAVFELRDAISVPNNVQIYIQLLNFKYSNVFSNISSSENVFYYQFATGGIQSITVPAGTYNINSLITALTAAGFTFVYSEVSLRLTITNSTAFKIIDGTNTINRILGVEPFSTLVTSYICPYAINLTGVQGIQLQMPNLSLSSNGVIGSNFNVLEFVPNDKRTGSTISYSPQINKTKVNANNINNIEVNLLDEDGNDLDFIGSNWLLSISLSFWYKTIYQPDTSSLEEANNTV